MSTGMQLGAKVASTPKPSFTPAPAGILQRRCACGGTPGIDGECEECRAKRLSLQRNLAQPAAPSPAVPPIVHEVLSSSGQPLNAGTRAFMEPRFGHDFSKVRIHTDAKAAESAQAVNALAYTVGRDVVFGAGQYTPGMSQGRRLLAHELTHVVQQKMIPDHQVSFSESTIETEAQQNAANIVATRTVAVRAHANAGVIQRQKGELDANAIFIQSIAQAKDRTPEKRATDLVWYILGQYYSLEKSKVSNVIYKKERKGLLTEVKEGGIEARGVIEVGDDFVESTTNKYNFGRSVLQVGHELEHIDQHRQGMGGPEKHDQREFLAFYDEAFAEAKPGTGGVQRSMRAHLIDTAIGYYYCLRDDLKDTYKPKLQKLLDQRPHEIKRGYERAKPPTSCERPKEDESAK